MDTRVRVKTGKLVKPKAPKSTIEVQYPLAWFVAKKDSKPTMAITLVTGSLVDSRKALKKAIQDLDIPVDLAVTFLYQYLRTVTAVTLTAWTSYGVKIADAGATVCPLDLVNIDTTDGRREITNIEQADDRDDAWMAIYVAGIYRSIRAKITEYKARITERINEQILSAKAGATALTEGTDVYISWTGNREYNFLIAVIDMYFNRFPDHPMSNIRVGTTGSRFKDCAALMSYGYILEHLGMEHLTELLDWVFVSQVGDDIDRLMPENEELGDPYSYFPYQVDLGLVQKSAFSASSNPHFFELVHMVGALLRSTRSMNARHISDSQSMNILMNAACIAYAYANTFEVNQVYAKDLTEANRLKESTGVTDEINDEEEDQSPYQEMIKSTLKSRDPSDWVLLLNSLGNQMPRPVKVFVKNVGRSIKDPRAGTIDSHLSKIIASL